MTVTIFTMEVCPNCEMLKAALNQKEIKYKELAADTAEGITEMKFNGCFAMEMPVVFLEATNGENQWLEHEDLFYKGMVSDSALSVMEDWQ